MHAITSQATISKLVRNIKSHLAKAANAVEKAEQHQIAAGLYLKQLKTKKPPGEPWYEYVERVFNLSQERADQLIRIADGKTTYAKERESQKKRDAKRGRAPKSSVDHTGLDDGLALNQFRRTDGAVKAACDYNPEDPEDVEEPGDSMEAIRRRIFMHHASEALRHARENGLDKATRKEITSEIISASQQAAEAWADLTEEFQRRSNKGVIK